MTPAYVLSDDAEEDLRGVIRYTLEQWGDDQVRSYFAKLETGIAQLVVGRKASKDLSSMLPSLRMARCEHHYVFWMSRDGELPLVIAVFHERMDLLARLAARLDAAE